MRKFLYVVLGLAMFAGAFGYLYIQQLSPADDGPAVSEQAAPSKQAPDGDRTRALRADRPERSANDRRERRIDRGINQYRRNDGSWNTFAAIIDVLNVIVGIFGIGLAISGMRARREARRDA